MATLTAESRSIGSPEQQPLLEIDDLHVTFQRKGGRPTRAVDGVSYDVRPGEIVGVVGESGSGKSVTSLAVMGLLPTRGVRVWGTVRYGGRDLLKLSDGQLARLRGRDLSMVFQDPMSSLNPVIRIGVQISEVLLAHRSMSRAAARDEAENLLRQCGIPDPRRRLDEYPHQLSGGMRQRVMIAIALACKPKLLICDEPTTALDVTIQAQVLELLKELVTDLGTAMIMITHDLGVVAGLCDRINVMYAGRIVESGERKDLFAHPRHRYTEGLLGSIPRLNEDRTEPLHPIPGTPRDVVSWDDACAFAPRCRYAEDDCIVGGLELVGTERPNHLLRCVHPVPYGPSPEPADVPEGQEGDHR